MEVMAQLLPLIVLFAIFYFLVIRPQQVQTKKHKEMIASLTRGDKIITSGGLYAEVLKTEEDFIRVKLNDDVVVRLSRDFVAKKLDTTTGQ